MKKDVVVVCFYGPESTGKTTMAARLAGRFQTEYVAEVGREVIIDNSTFTADDIIRTATLQVERIQEKKARANRILFVDSDHLTTAIYSQQYLGMVPAEVYELARKISYDQYFLFDIDVPWVDDGMRDLGGPDQRKLMKGWFQRELDIRRIPYVLVEGSWKEREQIILDALKSKFGLTPQF